MESRIRNLFLNHAALLSVCCLALYSASILAAEPVVVAPDEVVKPQVDRRQINKPRIDSEDFEIGVFGGLMSVEDFGVNPVIGTRLDYHITEDFFVEAAAAQTETTKTSYERLSGAAELLTGDQRKLTYYNLSLGYNLLPGEVFLWKRRAFNTALYVIAGAGSTRFAGDDLFTFNVGIGYRFLATDWLAIHADVRDHVYDLDLLGETRSTHNIEISGGVALFF